MTMMMMKLTIVLAVSCWLVGLLIDSLVGRIRSSALRDRKR